MSSVETALKVYNKVYNMKITKAVSAIGNMKQNGIGAGAFSWFTKNDLRKTSQYLIDAFKYSPENVLRHYGRLGVQRLTEATPIETGTTAYSWKYEISKEPGRYVLTFSNSNVQNGVNIAYILQMGHGTRQGGYVRGVDYINPALQPIFDDIANGIFKEVANL